MALQSSQILNNMRQNRNVAQYEPLSFKKKAQISILISDINFIPNFIFRKSNPFIISKKQ
jgi:hypothetical protein